MSAALMASSFMGGGGSGGGNSLDMSSGVGPFELDNDNDFGDWGGDISFAPQPSKSMGIDLSNPGHVALLGAGMLILGAVLMKRAR